MTSDEVGQEPVEQLLDTPELATALESDQFKKFLDQVPIAIAVSDLRDGETVVYANPEFEKLSGLTAARIEQENWEGLSGSAVKAPFDRRIDEAIVTQTDFVGTFASSARPQVQRS